MTAIIITTYLIISIVFTRCIMKGEDLSTERKREAAALMCVTFLMFGPLFLVALILGKAVEKVTAWMARG